MEALGGRGCAGWAGYPRGVGDGERGEQPARGARRAGYQYRGPEPGRERGGVQVAGAGDARQRRQDGDGQQAADPGRVVIDRGRDP